ncbi:SpoIIE family protein phosphatase [Micromonospora sp. NPDC000668]|uniref:SpoIIE family protein phosphatase n=1 Tax=Micromonospora sp. NPDC000668 TaxID=3364219 RepID=UPI0036A85FC5
MSTTRQPTGHPLPADSQLARELLDGLAEAVLTTDAGGRVTLVNATATELLPEITAGVDLSRCPVPALARAIADDTESFDAEHRGPRGGPRGVEMFGEARLSAALASAAGLPPAALVDWLLQLVDEWLDGQAHDDIAMLAVRASAPA